MTTLLSACLLVVTFAYESSRGRTAEWIARAIVGALVGLVWMALTR